MRLSTNLTVRIKNGFLPHLTNEIYKRNCGIRNITLLENLPGFELFLIEIIYPSYEKYNGLINKISKHEENFQIVSSENKLEQEITGGMLDISGGMNIDNIVDYEMNILGATELILNKLKSGDDALKYSGISKNIGLFCSITDDVEAKEEYLKIYALAEKDSIIIKTFSGLNSFPVIIKMSEQDDFFKVIQRVEETFSAIRIFNLDDADDISLYERFFDDISLPLLSQYYDEIPLCLLIAIYHLLDKHNIDIKTCTIGFVGINISSLRMARLLLKQGISRVLGIDNSVKLMHGLEKEGGIATTLENVFNSSDLIIFFKKQFDMIDLNRLGTGQLLISLLNDKLETDVIRQRGVRDFLQSGWMDFSALFPGLLKGMIEFSIKHLDDDKIIKLSKKIFSLKKRDEVLPVVFSDLHKSIPGLLSEFE